MSIVQPNSLFKNLRHCQHSYLEKYWMYFYRTFHIGAFYDKGECFGVKRSKFKVTLGSDMQDDALFGLVNAISWKLLDWISPDFQHWCILRRRWMPPCLGSKCQRSRSQHDQGPSRWRNAALHAVCRVLIASSVWFCTVNRFCTDY